jgi:uncharacterized RDD family membrane protein YckC
MVAPRAAERRFRVAGMWRRALAGALDGVVLVPTMALFAAVTATAGGRPLHGLRELGPNYAIELVLDGGGVGLAALGMAGVVAFLYFFVFHVVRGQTPAERLVGIRVIDPFGERPAALRALVRTLGGFVSLGGCGLGLLWIGFDREKRALHDWLAGTYVVRSRWRPPVEAAASAPVAEGGR